MAIGEVRPSLEKRLYGSNLSNLWLCPVPFPFFSHASGRVTRKSHIPGHKFLVVWNMAFIFHTWDVILPIDEVIFFKIVKATNQ